MSEVKTNKISSLASNNDITIDPDGTGNTIVASGSVGIGTPSGTQPSYFNSFLNVQNNASTSDHASVTITSGSGGFAGLHFGDSDNGRIGQVAYNNADNALIFTANNSERMRINSSGKLGIGTSSPDSSLHVASDAADFVARFYNDGNNANRLGVFVQTGTDDGSGTNVFFAAYDGDGTETGQLRSVSGTFQLTDTSDERLKQDIVDTTVSGLTSVNAMRIRDFAYRRNPTETIEAGFVAQELQTAFPSAVSYSESDDDKILSVSRERLVPVLVKAIQELSAKNDALEARITALEAE